MASYQYWLDNGVKIFSLQFDFLRSSIYDLKTDESDPSFLSESQKATHHQTYTKFLQHTKPNNYIFANYKYTSPYTMTNMYTLDHSCITGYLRNYDPIKQYFCLLPYNNTSRPLIVPQEYLIHFDGFLLPCNIPTQIVKPLTVIKHLVSSPLDEKDKSYYTALYKQSYSYNELLFISAKVISFMVQNEPKTEHKSHTSPIRNTPDKLSSVLNNRTLRDITNLLDPYKRTPSETPITTITHILHCYDRTHKLLQTLDLDSQRITQSSQAIQCFLRLIVKLYKTISIKYYLKDNITLFSSIAHGFFNILTAQMVNDLHETQNQKPKHSLFRSKSLDHLSDTSVNLITHPTGITSPPPFYTKRPNKLHLPKFKLFPKRHLFSHPKTTLQATTLPFSPDQHPPIPHYTSNHSHPNDNLATPHDTSPNIPVTSNTDTPIKIYSRINYPFPPPSS